MKFLHKIKPLSLSNKNFLIKFLQMLPNMLVWVRKLKIHGLFPVFENLFQLFSYD